MSTYRFHEGVLPDGYTPGFETAIFNTPDFRMLQAAAGWISCYILNDDQRKISAASHFHLQEDRALSPLRAPFGSIDCAGDLSPAALYDFLAFIEHHLRSLGVREVVIKNPPRVYDPEFLALVETFLLNREFTVAGAETGAVIHVTDRDFTEGIAHAQSLRAKQARNAGLKFRVLPLDHLDEVFSFIAACHREKGYKLSIAPGQLRAMTDKFPDHYLLSTVEEEKAIVSAAISVRVKNNVLYNFLVNHEKRVNALSPPVLLMEGLYSYCQANRISLLDLGTSALAGAPNFPLLDFKLRMGARATSRFSFYKQLS